jgi:hypothetical protein
MDEKHCLLKESVGQVEACPHDACAFWEAGGALVPAGCAIERLGLTGELRRTSQFAGWLLGLREQLELAGSDHERHDLHRQVRQLLPPGLRD